MTFQELKEYVNKMNEVELLQLVHIMDGTAEYEIDIVCSFRGQSLFISAGVEADDSTVDAS